MKKLLALFFIVGSFAMALNFSGSQSLNGLQSQAIFTAPAAGIYFVNGQLQLPMPTGSGMSQVVAVVSQNGSQIYRGIAGATGFQINQITCVSGDAITVNLSSTASVDKTTNAVSGQVYYGNSF